MGFTQTVVLIIASAFVCILSLFMWSNASSKLGNIYDRAKEIGLIEVNKETGDTIYFDSKFKYVLTGKSRFYGE